MKCPKCDSDNTDTARFCSNCATSLTSPDDPQPTFTKTLETPYPVVTQGTIFANRYEILEKIGEGGMGEVYRSLDRNLDRQVAIKILPSAFAEEEERLARFEREAKLLAVLNHTNIAAIYGLEESEGRRFLVLELVEGETLKSKLDRGPLEVEEALDLCRQIADGLETAHEKGIVHRDLKPGNIMVTPEGMIKILDFGLAKAFTGETTGTGIDIEKSPTITAQMTRPGVVMGTAAYMSPEQARGRVVDKRADIWAFGCVLFECLTGMRAFEGETVSDNLALILKGEPDWAKLPSNTPAFLKSLLRRCLQKDPRMRLHDIADARIEMAEAESSPLEVASGARRLPWSWILPICGACILIGVLFGFFLKGSGGISSALVRSVIKTEPGYVLAPKAGDWQFAWPYNKAMVISKDGGFIIYCAVNNNPDLGAKPQLFMKRLKEQAASPILGTEGGIAPFLSPDNLWIGFWRDRKLWKVHVDGGVPQDLCEAPFAFGASWGENGQIVFSNHASTGLYSISSDGGRTEVLTKPVPEQREKCHRLPHHLPNGKGLLFTIMSHENDQEPCIAIIDFKTGRRRELLKNAADACYIKTGHILFLRQGTLYAVPFDINKAECTGQPVAVITDVLHMMNAGSSRNRTAEGQFSISESGSLVYASGGTIPNSKDLLVWVDQAGNLEHVSSQTGPFFAPRLSSDGKSILFVTLGTEPIVGTYDIERAIFSTITSAQSIGWALFSPLRNDIVFSRPESGPQADIFIKAAKGNTKIEPLIKSPYNKYPCSFSPDGNLLAYIEATNAYDILIYDFRDQSSTPFAATEHSEAFPEFSPDGRLIAYCTNKEGSNEVYVSHSSGTGEPVKVSRDGGIAPLWARSGKKLFYLASGFSQVWVSDVLDENIPSFRSPRLLVKETKNLFWSVPVRGYDISLDDQRFLTVKFEDRQPQPVTEIHLIQNWFEELKRLVPARK